MEREISIILKVRGAAAAKKAVQDVFNNQTVTLVKGFNTQTKKAGDNVKRVGNTAKRAKTKVMSFTKVLGRGMAALYLYNRAWAVIGTNFESGMQLERASAIFKQNVGDITQMLPELRSATAGVVNDLDLLKKSNRAFQQGISSKAMANTFKMATVAAQKLGLNANTAIDSITSAITKQNEGALETLGIITSTNQEYKTQVALMAKSGGVMSKAMSIQLRQNIIMKELQKRFGGVNKVQADGLQILERFKASWANFRAELGITLGVGLRPLIQALTGTLDLVTRLLNTVNKTGGFHKFVQLTMAFAGVIGTMKFISASKGLLTLFGFMGGKSMIISSKMLLSVHKLMRGLGRTVLALVPRFRNFLAALSMIAPRLIGVLKFIPGWGTALTLVTLLFDPLVSMLKKGYLAAKVFFQLLSNFDENSGMSRVLRKDRDELGKSYNAIENIAKDTLTVWAVLKGIGQGLAEAFAPVGTAISWVSDKVSSLAQYLTEWKPTTAVATAGLDSITRSVKNATKYIGFLLSAVAMLIPGLQGIGIAGMTLFGGAIANDLGAGDAIASGMGAVGSLFSPSPEPAMAGAAQPDRTSLPSMAIPQQSTQMAPPEPRPQNLDTVESSADILKKMNKILEKQTDMMEVDSQKSDIRESQQSAKNNILNR